MKQDPQARHTHSSQERERNLSEREMEIIALVAEGLTNQEIAETLTIKAPPTQLIGQHPDGLIRQEFEYPIPIEDAEALLCMAPHQVCKWRHGLDLAGGDWVLDVFDGPNAPLVVAEVELADARQAVSVPPWCVLELTGRHELSNAALACKPFVSWPDAPRALLLQALETTTG